MKGDPNVINVLNSLLSEELTAINQYIVHSEMCENWGYGKLHKEIEKRAIVEMKHAEKLISRILFLEGIPIVSNLNAIHIGADVPKMFAFDHNAELDAVKNYNSGIVTCGDARDYATRDLLQSILKDEDDHVDEIENVQDEIAQIAENQTIRRQMQALELNKQQALDLEDIQHQRELNAQELAAKVRRDIQNEKIFFLLAASGSLAIIILSAALAVLILRWSFNRNPLPGSTAAALNPQSRKVTRPDQNWNSENFRRQQRAEARKREIENRQKIYARLVPGAETELTLSSNIPDNPEPYDNLPLAS